MNIAILISILVGLIVLVLVLKLFLAMLPIFLVILLGLIPFLLMIAGLVSCVNASKPRNIKLLWILVIILAPFLGPLLWFLWGKRST